jgi:hypothetical protein
MNYKNVRTRPTQFLSVRSLNTVEFSDAATS